MMKKLALSLSMALGACAFAATPMDDAVVELQREWEVVRYQVPAADKLSRWEALAAKAHKYSAQYPAQSEPLIWEGIIVSTWAGDKGGLGALGLVKDAKKMYERALEINPQALDGSAYNSLGVLYAKVPGWPVSFGDKDKARDMALNVMHFFEHESCGQCTPCRVGTSKAAKLMQSKSWDKETLEDLATVMVDASICGLGQAAPNPIRCIAKYFPQEVA